MASTIPRSSPPSGPGVTDEEERPAGEPAGPVVLDVGGDLGALVVHTDRRLLGDEIEIEFDGSERRTHVAVLERRTAGGITCAAVFSRLPEGRYLLVARNPTRRLPVQIVGGEVAELDMRTR
ncbi:MAG: phospholipase [Candidatus Dormibacteraeota bacterium]|nr:phospholipase [Candidatus Dormibacteraeota bacterium]